MYKKLVSLLLVFTIVTGYLAVSDISSIYSYAGTEEDEDVATSSNAKRNKEGDEIDVATSSEASKKSEVDEDNSYIGTATNSNASIATNSNAAIATSSNAKQKVYDFNKSIKKISLLKEEDYSIVTEENPIQPGDNVIFRFEYKLKSSMKKELLTGKEVEFEYQLPDGILSLVEYYNELTGVTIADGPSLDCLPYSGEFINNGLIQVKLLPTDEEGFDDLEKSIDIPVSLNHDINGIPEKIIIPISHLKKVTLFTFVNKQFYYEEVIDGVTIHISADRKVLPDNVEVKIIRIDENSSEFESILRSSMEGVKNEETIAFDISFWKGDNEIKLNNGLVHVSFISPDLINDDRETTVFHINDENVLEVLPSIQTGDEINFDADHFSVFGFTNAYTLSDDPLGNPLIGGTSEGDWKGNYIYFGWEGLDENRDKGKESWQNIKDYVDGDDFYRLNGQLYSKSDLMTPIKWRILNNNGNALLLLSDQLLDVYGYGTTSNDHPTWETSSIREWLNNEFINYHFTSEEQADIKKSTVTDIVPSDSNLPAGNTTEDILFLPSKEELAEEDFGFPANGESLSRQVTYNNSSLKTRNTAGDKSYWTRSRGDLNFSFLRPVFVGDTGICGYGANRYSSWLLGVRPMLRLDIDSQLFGFNKTDSNMLSGIKFDKAYIELKVGEIKELKTVAINIEDDLAGLKWVSSNPSIVSIGNDGKLSAKSDGDATIYAIKGQYIASGKVTVKENPKQYYEVIFKDGDVILSRSSVEEGMAATPPDIKKEGYTLTWDKDFSIIQSDLEINTVWTANTYKIDYVLNGGTNHQLNPQTYTVGIGAVLQRPAYNNFPFVGWYTTPDFRTGTETTIIAPNHTGDMTVYAKWKLPTYNINYILNGGTNNVTNPLTYIFGIEVVLQEPTFRGYVFEGWYTTSDYRNGTELIAINPNQMGDITVFAKWKKAENNNQEGNSSGGGHSSSGGGNSGTHSSDGHGSVAVKEDTYPNSSWEQINGIWKLKKSDGLYAIGWFNNSGNTYYTTGFGELAIDRWCSIDGHYYYFNAHGVLERTLSAEEWRNNISPEVKRESIAKEAQYWVGKIQYGGGYTLNIEDSTPPLADCSGFVKGIYSSFGVDLPWSTEELNKDKTGRRLDVSKQTIIEQKLDTLMPGDLLCFSNHVAIYIGDGKMVHSLNKEKGCVITNLNEYVDEYYTDKNGARQQKQGFLTILNNGKKEYYNFDKVDVRRVIE